MMGWIKSKLISLPFVQKFLQKIMHTPYSVKHVHGLHKIEMFVLGVASLMVFLTLAGWFRRNKRFGIIFRKVLLLGFIAVPSLINNSLGRLNKIEDKYDYSTYLVTWATLLLIGHASGDSINTMEVPRNDDFKKFIFQFLLFAFLLGWFILESECMPVHLFVIGMLWVVIFFKVEERARAFWYASEDGVAKVTQFFADYMMYEHKLSDTSNPTTLEGYKYLVDVRNVGYNMKPPTYRVSFNIKNAITLDQIWGYLDQDQGKLLNSRDDPNRNLKDLSLSMSLFWLLLRRFGGYSLYESKLAREKTRRFVQDGLLADGVKSPERVFEVIEIELKFLYDFLYTKYFAGYIGSWWLMKRFCQLAIIVTLSAFYIWLNKFLYGLSRIEKVTRLALMAFTIIELVQMIILLTSEWYKMMWICWYVRRVPATSTTRLWGKIIRLICIVLNKKQWSRRLGQYSLLSHFDYNPCIFRFFRRFCLGDLVGCPRIGQKESSNVELSTPIMESFVSSLQKDVQDHEQINGISVWKRSGFSNDDLIHKCCKLETQTHVILVWHLATSFCEISYGGSKQVPTHVKKDLKVANDLSMYCAYLVAFEPKLLRVPEKTTSSIFDQVIKEANKTFGRNPCKSRWFSRCLCKDKSMFEKMNEITDNEGNNNTITRGVLLGKQLKASFNNQDGQLWKNLAEFWTEMLLFLAPSNDHIVHAEHLAKGGELITHLWALLTHAGFVEPKQFVSDQTTSNDANDVEIEIN